MDSVESAVITFNQNSFYCSQDSDWFLAHTVIHVEIPIHPTKWECSAVMALLHVIIEKFNKRHC